MKHEHLVAGLIEGVDAGVDTCCRVAEHRRGDDGSFVHSGFDVGLDHTADSSGGSGVDAPGDAVDASDVDDGRDQDHIAQTDKGGGVTGGGGGHADLWHPQGQRAHGGTDDAGATGAAHAEDAVESTFAEQPGCHHGSACCHHFHRLATVADGTQIGQNSAPSSGHVTGRDVDYKAVGRGQDAGIDGQGVMTATADALPQIGVVCALGVEGAYESDGSWRRHGGKTWADVVTERNLGYRNEWIAGLFDPPRQVRAVHAQHGSGIRACRQVVDLPRIRLQVEEQFPGFTFREGDVFVFP